MCKKWVCGILAAMLILSPVTSYASETVEVADSDEEVVVTAIDNADGVVTKTGTLPEGIEVETEGASVEIEVTSSDANQDGFFSGIEVEEIETEAPQAVVPSDEGVEVEEVVEQTPMLLGASAAPLRAAGITDVTEDSSEDEFLADGESMTFTWSFDIKQTKMSSDPVGEVDTASDVVEFSEEESLEAAGEFSSWWMTNLGGDKCNDAIRAFLEDPSAAASQTFDKNDTPFKSTVDYDAFADAEEQDKLMMEFIRAGSAYLGYYADASIADNPEWYWCAYNMSCGADVTAERNGDDVSLYWSSMELYASESFPDAYAHQQALMPKAQAVYNEILAIADYDGYNGVTDEEFVLALHDYICDHAHYDYSSLETDSIIVHTVDPFFFGDGGLVCDGYAGVFKLLCDMRGIENIRVVNRHKGAASDHMWNLVKLNQIWYHLDVTWDDPAFETDYPLYDYFLVPAIQDYTHEYAVVNPKLSLPSPIANSRYEHPALASIDDCIVTVANMPYGSDRDANGNEVGPGAQVKVVYPNGKVAQEGVDYLCEYANDIPDDQYCRDVGTYQVDVWGIGPHLWDKKSVSLNVVRNNMSCSHPAQNLKQLSVEIVDGTSPCMYKEKTVLQCTLCGGKVTRLSANKMRPDAHHAFNVITIIRPATCVSPGMELRKCMYCNLEVSVSTSLGSHKFGAWTTTRPATCTSTGIRTRTCTVCKKKETQSIAKRSHAYGPWTVVRKASCDAPGMKRQVCSKCNAQVTQSIPQLTHQWSSWKTVQKATYTKTGRVEQHCVLCGKSVVKEIPMLDSGFTVSYPSSSRVRIKATRTFIIKASSKLSIKYVSANKSIATVGPEGKVTGVRPGTTTITVKSGTKTKKITVTVTE